MFKRLQQKFLAVGTQRFLGSFFHLRFFLLLWMVLLMFQPSQKHLVLSVPPEEQLQRDAPFDCQRFRPRLCCSSRIRAACPQLCGTQPPTSGFCLNPQIRAEQAGGAPFLPQPFFQGQSPVFGNNFRGFPVPSLPPTGQPQFSFSHQLPFQPPPPFGGPPSSTFFGVMNPPPSAPREEPPPRVNTEGGGGPIFAGSGTNGENEFQQQRYRPTQITKGPTSAYGQWTEEGGTAPIGTGQKREREEEFVQELIDQEEEREERVMETAPPPLPPYGIVLPPPETPSALGTPVPLGSFERELGSEIGIKSNKKRPAGSNFPSSVRGQTAVSSTGSQIPWPSQGGFPTGQTPPPSAPIEVAPAEDELSPATESASDSVGDGTEIIILTTSTGFPTLIPPRSGGTSESERTEAIDGVAKLNPTKWRGMAGRRIIRPPLNSQEPMEVMGMMPRQKGTTTKEPETPSVLGAIKSFTITSSNKTVNSTSFSEGEKEVGTGEFVHFPPTPIPPESTWSPLLIDSSSSPSSTPEPFTKENSVTTPSSAMLFARKTAEDGEKAGGWLNFRIQPSKRKQQQSRETSRMGQEESSFQSRDLPFPPLDQQWTKETANNSGTNESGGMFGHKVDVLIDQVFNKNLISTLNSYTSLLKPINKSIAAKQRFYNGTFPTSTSAPKGHQIGSKTLLLSTTPSSLLLEKRCNTPPQFTPCVPLAEANTRLLECCKKRALPSGCLPLCRYDATQAEIKGAFDRAQCGLVNILPYLECASQNTNNVECCKQREVAKKTGPQCEVFCNPSGGIALGLQHIVCQNSIQDFLQCHHSGLKP